jgi:hypothetical protein
MAYSIGVKFPQFHGDFEIFPEETWEGYEIALAANRLASGCNDFTEVTLKGQMLSNLRGKATRFRECNPELLIKPYGEVLRILREKYSDSGVHNLMQLHSVIQQPGETVSDLMSRLLRAAKPLFDRKPILEKLEQIQHSAKEWSSELVSAVQEIGTGVKETMDAFLYHFFMRGLNDKIKMGLGTSEPKDMYEAQTLAERQERFMKLYGQSTQTRSVNVIEADNIDKLSHQMNSYQSDTEDDFSNSDIESEDEVPINIEELINTQSRSGTPQPYTEYKIFNVEKIHIMSLLISSNQKIIIMENF